MPNNTKKEEKNKEEECKYCDSHDLKCPKNSSPQSPLSEQTECPKCKRRSDFVDMKDCPFCDPEYKPLTLNPLIKNRSLEDEIPEIARGLKEVSEIMKHKEVTKTTKVPQSPLSEERWCAKALDNLKEARLQGQRDERERLRQKAIEYKEKGFELETFIYSGFIEDLPTPPTEEVKDQTSMKELLSGNKE